VASALDDLITFGRYARRLPSFMRTTLGPDRARAAIEERLRRREEGFLILLERGVYANPRSPYRRLLEAAGMELGDARNLFADLGLEGALRSLRDAGVYATLDEFKGRKPLERGGVSLPLDEAGFDNPLSLPHYRVQSSGSRGKPSRVAVDLALREQDAAYHALFLAAFRLQDRPFAIWRAIPPSSSGINNCLLQAKVGAPVAKWFSPYRARRTLEALGFALFSAYTIRVGRLCGARLAAPEHCPPDDPERVARWLSAMKRNGTPAVIDTQIGLGVRACTAAVDEGLDISGTFFRFGGEPYTEAKAAAVAASESRAVCHYSMTEAGRVALACGAPVALDDMHFAADKLAVLQRDRVVDAAGQRVGALSYTTLFPAAPKIMINVESGDYGILQRRECGCPLGELGLSLHVHGVRSYDKLTSEGIHFLGSDLYALVDEVLPGRFGGAPTDYQLVEEEVRGVPRVSVVVGPGIGPVAEQDVVSATLDFLRMNPGNRLMADTWQQSDTLHMVRREPHVTTSGKILPLHIERATELPPARLSP
jgi:hypothetical protein